MMNERVTYTELNVAKSSRNQQRKPRGRRSSISVIEQEITYAEFSFQDASPEHRPVCRDRHCKGFPSPLEKLIAGSLGIISFALLVAVIVITTVATPYTEAKAQSNSSLPTTNKGIYCLNPNLSLARPCDCCPTDGISYSHNCYYIGVEKKSWNDSSESCIYKTCNLLYINNEEEMDFLKSLSVVSWVGVFRKSRSQPWVWKNDSTFKPKIADSSHDEHNCAMLSASGLTADNCATLHTYLCKFPALASLSHGYDLKDVRLLKKHLRSTDHSRITEEHRAGITAPQTGIMGDLLGPERRSESREAAKKTQSQLHFSKGAKDHPLECSLQHASWKHLKTSRHHNCKNFLSPPEKLISGILGIIWFALLVALVISARVASPYIEPKEQNHSLVIITQKGTSHLNNKLINHNLSSAHPCRHCPKDWISYSHNCYYIGVEKKSWNDSSESCMSQTCNLLYINNEEEMDFLKSLSAVSWVGVFRKSRSQPWVWKNDSTFKPKIADSSHDEHNCAMLSASGLTAENCAALHRYLCKCKPTR
ncbi:uncharacterized protein LOC129679995 [Psammomys obesus]|uniref:uncharacterized protein LOC129679995 n=1 Tax=Psammomys obesus TaxID=48139 RepID=UPI002452B29A|nr:uncharacterized protein LOC129679995 [Psammomys obesus]